MNESFISTKKKLKYFVNLNREEIPKTSFEMSRISQNIVSYKKSTLELEISVKIDKFLLII